MPSLSEMLAEQERKELEAAAKAEAAAPLPAAAPVRAKKSPPVLPPVEELEEPESSKKISSDTLRGLYWLATTDHVGDKKATRAQLKRKVRDRLLTMDGMRVLLNSLEKFVFS